MPRAHPSGLYGTPTVDRFPVGERVFRWGMLVLCCRDRKLVGRDHKAGFSLRLSRSKMTSSGWTLQRATDSADVFSIQCYVGGHFAVASEAARRCAGCTGN